MNSQSIKTQLQIKTKTQINHDCYIYNCIWSGPSFQLSIGQHMRFSANINGEHVVRKYTPISPCSQNDSIDFLLKIYRPTPQFPQGGKMTRYLEGLHESDKIDVEGPFGRLQYYAGGRVVIDGSQILVKRFFMIAGGSGITPVYQTIIEILKMKDEKVQLILLFANKTQEDIVLRKQLQSLPNLKLYYILDKPPQNWVGFSGYITKEILLSICPLDDPDTLYIHCGPFLMNKLIRQLFNSEYPKSNIFKY